MGERAKVEISELERELNNERAANGRIHELLPALDLRRKASRLATPSPASARVAGSGTGMASKPL